MHFYPLDGTCYFPQISNECFTLCYNFKFRSNVTFFPNRLNIINTGVMSHIDPACEILLNRTVNERYKILSTYVEPGLIRVPIVVSTPVTIMENETWLHLEVVPTAAFNEEYSQGKY